MHGCVRRRRGMLVKLCAQAGVSDKTERLSKAETRKKTTNTPAAAAEFLATSVCPVNVRAASAELSYPNRLLQAIPTVLDGRVRARVRGASAV